MFCVYVTFYKGNKMPPFYIGYSSLKNLKENNYHGSVKSRAYKSIWKEELKDDKLFKTKIISLCETEKLAKSKETYFQRYFNVHKNPMYINRSIQGEKFYRENKEYSHSDETKRKIGAANSLILKGKSPGNKGKPMSEQQKQKLSKANSGKIMPEETKRKISSSMLGKKKSEEHRRKFSEARTGVPYKDGRIHHFKGKKRSLEDRKKISDSLRKNPIITHLCLFCQKSSANKFCSKECKINYRCKCPHCKVEGNGYSFGSMIRFHFEKCKSAPALTAICQ